MNRTTKIGIAAIAIAGGGYLVIKQREKAAFQAAMIDIESGQLVIVASTRKSFKTLKAMQKAYADTKPFKLYRTSQKLLDTILNETPPIATDVGVTTFPKDAAKYVVFWDGRQQDGSTQEALETRVETTLARYGL